MDWGLCLAVTALSLFGWVMVYSATREPGAVGWVAPGLSARKQAVWLVVSAVACLATLVFDYRSLARRHVPIYVFAIVLLILVLRVGITTTGATSWFQFGAVRLQPSELAKIAVILSLSAFLSRRRADLHTPAVVWRSLGLVALPVLLVLPQPDFGTALVMIAIWFGSLALAGARARHLLLVGAGGIVLFALMWNVNRIPPGALPRPVARVVAQAGLHDYQKRRLTIFLNPQSDPTGAGYQVLQSKIAIGSGKLFGRGLFHNTQGRLHFVPEQRTDFIFSVVGEELGLAGCVAMLGLFFFIFWRGMRIAIRARDPLGSLLAAGVVSMLAFHTVVNVGMNVNVMPITGLPLPFVSYGGSNLLASSIGLGLLLNVHLRRERAIF